MIEAKRDFHWPYLRLGLSYKQQEIPRMTLLVLLKGKGIPRADPNLKSDIAKALAEFEDVTKTEVTIYCFNTCTLALFRKSHFSQI